MKEQPLIYMVTKQQVNNQDVNEFLRNAIQKEFGDRDFMIAGEAVSESRTQYSATPRKLKSFSLTVEGRGVTIYFDITDVVTTNQDKSSWKMF